MTISERAKELESKLLDLYAVRCTAANVYRHAEALGEIEDALAAAVAEDRPGEQREG